MSNTGAIYFVCLQAAARLRELSWPERQRLLVGLKLMLPADEYEQAALVHRSITEEEDARRRAEEAQLILGEMLTEAKGS